MMDENKTIHGMNSSPWRARIWNYLNPYAYLKKKRTLHGLYNPEEFIAVLDRECIRADRNGHEFSLVSFDIGNIDRNDDFIIHLLQVLKHRLRNIDEVGLLDRKNVGAFLPYTKAKDALRVAEDVNQAIITNYLPLSYSVYTYPSKWFNKNERNKQHSSPSELDSDVRSVSAEKTTVPTKQEYNIQVERLKSILIHKIPVWKRAMDIIGAIIGIVVFSPIMLAISFAIKISSKGPVLFKQQRTGQGLQRFKMFKFRTMVIGADKQFYKIQQLNEMTGPLIKIEKDPRFIKIGAFLRKMSLDELPQFFNVLKGDMTLIGPRALSPLPSKYESWQLRRFTVKPGLACTWQAERRVETDFVNWMRSDLRYLDNVSLLKDISLLLKTLLGVITLKGAR